MATWFISFYRGCKHYDTGSQNWIIFPDCFLQTLSLNVSFPAYKEGGSHDLWPIKQMQFNECANYLYLVTPAGEDFDKTNVSRSHPKSHSPNLTHVDVLSPGIKNQAARQCLPMMLPANIWNNVSGWSIHQPFTVMKNRFHNPKLPSAKPCCHQSQKTSLQESLK